MFENSVSKPDSGHRVVSLTALLGRILLKYSQLACEARGCKGGRIISGVNVGAWLLQE
jgi:hypothetical protein